MYAIICVSCMRSFVSLPFMVGHIFFIIFRSRSQKYSNLTLLITISTFSSINFKNFQIFNFGDEIPEQYYFVYL